ncbi:hypothetical protein ACSHT0_13120 [Tepidicaulis sp. LMO-SS28]|uniref:hypothetical protein n=1 Tax=Tepidicaulis sp. LMO-SS28 TaxID=3447455 RepID=UPI003EE11E14
MKIPAHKIRAPQLFSGREKDPLTGFCRAFEQHFARNISKFRASAFCGTPSMTS